MSGKISYTGLGLGAFINKLIDEFEWPRELVTEADVSLSRNPGRWIELNKLEIRRDGKFYSIRKK